jgi:UDP-glucuronate 4-epimerase
MNASHKKIFITGIAGFIGYHLALALKKRGDFVIGCDNFNDYYDPALKRARATNLEQAKIPVHALDICETEEIEKLLLENQITHFVHLAAQAGVRHSIKNPEPYVSTNLKGFVAILELLRKYPKVKLVYASSSSVYGMNKKIPFSEEDPTEMPANLYGATKKSNELLAHSYHHLFGLSVTGLRFFTVYGPWGRPDMAYFSFTKALLQGEPIKLYNLGKMERDFTYIDDIVQGTLAAIDLGAACEIFNLGGNQPYSIQTLISLLEQQTQKKAKLELLPLQLGEVPTTYADITKAQRLLGFQPKTSLSMGLSHFVDWYLEERQK